MVGHCGHIKRKGTPHMIKKVYQVIRAAFAKYLEDNLWAELVMPVANTAPSASVSNANVCTFAVTGHRIRKARSGS